MFKTEYVQVGAAVTLILAGALYLMSGDSPAQSHSGLSAPSQIDTIAIMEAAKDLPSQQFDAI